MHLNGSRVKVKALQLLSLKWAGFHAVCLASLRLVLGSLANIPLETVTGSKGNKFDRITEDFQF